MISRKLKKKLMDYRQRIMEFETNNKEFESKIKRLQEDNKLKNIKIENMNLTLNIFRKMIFGPGSEHTPEEFAAHARSNCPYNKGRT